MGKVGVIGAGVMGAGVAQDLAQAGHDVVLLDLDEETLADARERIRRSVRMGLLLASPSAAGSGSSSASGSRPGIRPDAVLEAISYTTGYESLGSVDYVVENVTEQWDVKKDVYPRLDAACPPHAVLAANTSAISITRLAALTSRPQQVVGVHFMNPVPLKDTVELIPGHHTSEDTLARIRELLDSMGKTAIVVGDAPGFVSNRVLMPMINEAAYLVFEQVASAEDVDRVFKSCFGHKMGPLETADLIGLDTILDSIEVLHESYGDSKYRPCPLLRRMVDAGLHGRKSGQGFFTY